MLLTWHCFQRVKSQVTDRLNFTLLQFSTIRMPGCVPQNYLKLGSFHFDKIEFVTWWFMYLQKGVKQILGGSKGSNHVGRHYKCSAMGYPAKRQPAKLCIMRNTGTGTSVPQFHQLTIQHAFQQYSKEWGKHIMRHTMVYSRGTVMLGSGVRLNWSLGQQRNRLSRSRQMAKCHVAICQAYGANPLYLSTI